MNDFDIKNLAGKFLIAVPGLKDPNFERTIVLICDHTNDGAFGLVINRILLNSFVPFLSWLNVRKSMTDLPVFYGGPVKPEQGYMLYALENNCYTSIKVSDGLALTTTKDILVDVVAGKGPNKFLFGLGYAGWAAGQLAQGAEGILSLFRGDRPFNGWLYVFDYWMVGDAPLRWHIYALVIKAISALAFLWLLRSLWPQKKVETAFMTLLFVVYPGFYQQPNALTFSHMLMAYGGALLSLALTIEALKAKKVVNKTILTLLALILAAFYILIFEVLIGLEAVRLILIWYFFRGEMGGWKSGFRRGIGQAAPYFLFTVGFVVWRILLFQSTRRSTNVDVLVGGYSSFPLHSLARLIFETIKDIFENAIFAWSVPYYQFTARVDYREMVGVFR